MNCCFICGDMAQHLHERHHIVPGRLNGSDMDENIVRLCPGCHRAIEKLYDRAFYERLSEQLRLGYSLNERGVWIKSVEPEGERVDDIEVGEDSEFADLSTEEKLTHLARTHEQIDDGTLDNSLNMIYKRLTDPDTRSLEHRMVELGFM